MSATAQPLAATIAVQDLKVGMHVHLDIGWMSHPFPLSSFRISSADQITTIQRLGLATVRWLPELSDIAPALPQVTVPLAAPEETPVQAERRARRVALQAQRAALVQCERQYAEAGRAWRHAAERVLVDPQDARQRTEALSRALMDKMLASRETCICMLTQSAGERAGAHALNVAVISLMMGRQFGLTDGDMLDLGIGALLHDIGKIELPDRVRQLQDGFTAAEVNLYRDHVTHGVSHGRRMGLAPGALLVVAQHHEHADGSGFPQRLNLDRMTVAARIVSLVNRYDKLCNPVHAGNAMSPHEALSLLFAQGKHKFDSTMLSAFIRMMGVYPPGSLVQLTDDRYAMVMNVNAVRPLKPRVLVADHKVDRDEALFVDLEAQSGAGAVGIRRSLKPSQLPPPVLAYLAPPARVTYFFEPARDPAPFD